MYHTDSTRSQAAATPFPPRPRLPDTAFQQRFKCVSFKPLRKGTLFGWSSVEMPSGLIVHDVGLFESHGKRWASAPSKPQIGRDGQQLTDPASGKPRYSPIVEFSTKAARDRWSDTAVAAVLAAHPEAFDA